MYVRPTWKEFQEMRLRKPNTLFIFDEVTQYLVIGSNALIFKNVLDRPLVRIKIEGNPHCRGLVLLPEALTWAIQEIKRQNFGLTVEIIGDPVTHDNE